MEECGYCGEIGCSARGYFFSTVVVLKTRALDLTGSRAGATAAVAGRSLRLHDLWRKSSS